MHQGPTKAQPDPSAKETAEQSTHPKKRPSGRYRTDDGIVMHSLREGVAVALESRTLDSALDTIAKQARQTVGAHQSAISYIPDGDFTRATHAVSLSDKYAKYRAYDARPTGTGIWALIFETGEPMRMTEEEFYSHPRFRKFSDQKDTRGLEHPHMPGWLAVPVKRPNGEPIGVLQLSDKIEGDFTEEDQNLLEHLASLISATFEVEYVNAELQRSNEELEQFAYAISHDLRAPLRAIHNLANWIEKDLAGAVPDKTKELLELLRGRVARMDKLLIDLLEYSRAGHVAFKIEQVAVRDVVSRAADSLDAENFSVVIDPTLPTLNTPTVPLERIFVNLISNTVKHHDRGGGNIEVKSEDHGSFHWFIVTDDGPGIPENLQEKAFEVFQTLRPRDRVEGSGMGLALVKKIVEGAGGTVKLRSPLTQDRGTEVRFSWPKIWKRRPC